MIHTKLSNRAHVRLSIMCIIAMISPAGIVRAGAMNSIVEYTTSGTVGTLNSTGAAVVGFEGVDHGLVSLPRSFEQSNYTSLIPEGFGSIMPLGLFNVSPADRGTTTNYDGTPFTINVTVDAIGGVVPPRVRST